MKHEFIPAYRSAGIDEKELVIADARYSRADNRIELTCRRDEAVDSERLAVWEAGIRQLMPDIAVAFRYENGVKQVDAVVLEAPPVRPNETEQPLPENGVLFGGGSEQKTLTAIADIVEPDKPVTVRGRLISAELKEGWQNKLGNGQKSYRVLFMLTDMEDSISCAATFFDEVAAARFEYWLHQADREERDLTVSGKTASQHRKKREGDAAPADPAAEAIADLTLTASRVTLADRAFRQETHEGAQQRVELHLHSRMSAMDGVTDLTQAFQTAQRFGHKALAVTDHGVVQAFPEAAKAQKATGVKALYGVEGYLVPDTEPWPMDGAFVVFDIETTGLKPEQCDILEIGAVRVEHGVMGERFHTYVNDGAVIPKLITDLTGITAATLEGAPRLREALGAFRAFCGSACLVAHNAKFDVGFLTHHGERLGIRFDLPYADTLMLSRYLLHDETVNHKLDTLCEYLGIDMGRHHRGDDDAASCAALFLHLMEMLRHRSVTTLPVIGDAAREHETHKKKEKHRSYHIIILATTQASMENLYRIISYSHLDHFRQMPMIPRSMLTVLREGLLLGSACEAGELFTAMLGGADDAALEKIAAYYDYLEIQPICNNRFLVREQRVPDDEGLRDLNRRILALGDRLGLPVAATDDAHFLDPEDAVYRKILLYKQGFSDAEFQSPLYFKTTGEMLEEFSYLGEERAYEVVVSVPNQIADRCETIVPFPDGTHAPQIPDAENILQTMAETRAHELYGDALPPIVSARLERELKSIIGNGFASLYLMAQRLVQKSLSDGYLVGSRGSVGSSFVATMAGITEVNPLPPHYLCPQCRFSDFDIDKTQYAAGADMPDLACPACGAPLGKEGFDIPFEVFLGFKGDKTPDIDLNFSGEYQPRAHKYVEEMFGRGHAFRAGTISGVADKKGFEIALHYADETGRTLRYAELCRLANGCLNVKITTGQHPGGIIIVPKEDEIYRYTPIQRPADKVDDRNTVTTHFDFHAMDDRLVKLDILGHDDPTALRMLEDLTGRSPRSIPLDDPRTRSLFYCPDALAVDLSEIACTTGTLGVPEFGTGFVRQVLEKTRPHTIEELVRIAGLTHGTNVWLNNAEPLVVGGIAKLSEVICTRDDIMNYLIAHGMEAQISFKIMERVRKGKGLTDEMETAMRDGAIPAWFIDSCKKIKYMFPRGHAVAYTMMAFRVAYYKVHHPLEFYAVYFTVRADAFDISKADSGAEAVLKNMRDIEKGFAGKKDSEVKKDKELLTILEIVYEMNLRGIGMLPVDMYKSDATRFLVEGDAIRPPFNAVPGIGSTAAKGIAERRGDTPFVSVEDFQTRTGANTGVVAALDGCGVFEGLPRRTQISLFDF